MYRTYVRRHRVEARKTVGARGKACPDRRALSGRDGGGLTKRYREPVEVTVSEAPVAFRWRGATYRVLTVLGHWREDAGYWSGGGVGVPQRDLWRVEAQGGSMAGGVYELVEEAGAWRLDRVWD